MCRFISGRRKKVPKISVNMMYFWLCHGRDYFKDTASRHKDRRKVKHNEGLC